MKENEFDAINKKRDELKDKLDNLLKTKAKVQKNRLLQLSPIIPKKFRKENKSYVKVNSKCDYNLIMSHKAKKEEEFEKQKEDFELSDCTFKPKIDERSNKMIKDHIEVFKRELPKKQPILPIVEEKVLNSTPRNFNPKFYEEKVNWKNAKYENHQKKKVDKTLEEIKTLKDPVLNTKKNEVLFKKDKIFLNRVQKDLINKIEKQQELEKKYYTSPFKPSINRDNEVEPRVWEHKNQLYDTLKRKK